MKLYLSSQHLGKPVERLIELVGEGGKAAVIANAIDDKPDRTRKDRVKRELKMLGKIGLQTEEMDLRDYFHDNTALASQLGKVSLVWVRGGNTFILRRAMAESGFDTTAVPLIKQGKLTYGGYSAALVIAGKDLAGIEMVDDPLVVPPDYPVATCPETGLGLLDFQLVPHEGSPEPWAKDVARYVDYLRQDGRPIVTLSDGEVYICSDEKEEIVGPPGQGGC